MTTVESGTAINIEYAEDETRAVALHEAGPRGGEPRLHEGLESTRISIRMRGGSLGHHQAAEQVERFSQWRSDQMATLIWGLGAMAAERVFYGQTTSGVGGDIQTVDTAGRAHGRCRRNGAGASSTSTRGARLARRRSASSGDSRRSASS